MKHLKLLFVFAVAVALFSSCKKTTDLSILMGHKWVLSSVKATYSDSTVSHNLMPANPICQTTSYTEFHDYTSSNPLRLAYTYATTNCQGQIGSPSVGLTSWSIDPDNTVLYLNGNTSNGNGGTWYNIQTLSSSSMVLTIIFQNQIGFTGGVNPQPIYDTETDTYTWSVK
jgi:hypothetical protein